jgi:hypothetical protein
MTSRPAQPSVGRIVHYVSTSDGNPCRAAVITEVPKYLTAEPFDGCPNGTEGQWLANLAVLNPTGTEYVHGVPHNDGDESTGAADCPEQRTHGNPFRYCYVCEWTEATPTVGTWHWPERVSAS